MITSTSNNNLFSQDEVIKKHNTASTSRESFKQINKTGLPNKEKSLLLEVIGKHQPVTSRSLVQLTGIERTNITRSLFDLLHDLEPLIKEAFIAPCSITGKNVKHYTLITWNKLKGDA